MVAQDAVARWAEEVAAYAASKHLFEKFMNGVMDSFRLDPTLNLDRVVHSMKCRLKDPLHLCDKLDRKLADGLEINCSNLFEKVTDFAGVRILHLHQDQFPLIHKFIDGQIRSGEWVLKEPALAYTWDPDAVAFFETLGLATAVKSSHYTSIHYVIKPRADVDICCEIQVRTLFEEIWGEIDHKVNYPHKTDCLGTREQIRVLSKLVSTGTRLADSIFRTENAHRVGTQGE